MVKKHFYTIEGIDGSGKSTITNAIADQREDWTVLSLPSDTQIGEVTRRLLEDQDSVGLANLHLYVADQLDRTERLIKPALNNQDVVISNRYIDSVYAYGLATLNKSPHFERREEAKSFLSRLCSDWPVSPRKTFYIDVDPEIAYTRYEVSDTAETLDMIQAAKRNYDAIIEGEDRFVRIDGNQSIVNIQKDIIRRLPE